MNCDDMSSHFDTTQHLVVHDRQTDKRQDKETLFDSK